MVELSPNDISGFGQLTYNDSRRFVRFGETFVIETGPAMHKNLRDGYWKRTQVQISPDDAGHLALSTRRQILYATLWGGSEGLGIGWERSRNRKESITLWEAILLQALANTEMSFEIHEP